METPESHLVRAAEGWLELGLPAEAAAELDRVRFELRFHPAVLGLRWAVFARGEDWLKAYRVGELLVKLAPTDPASWIHRAYAARRIPGGGVAEALELLLPAGKRFPKEPMVLFNLACYTCQLGDLPEARKWLIRALQAGGSESLGSQALQETDLKPLWPELESGSL